jgi:hypothetical protein
MALIRNSLEIASVLETYIDVKARQITDIEQLVERYEKQRLLEEHAYHSMSAIRKLLSGKKPDHHLAIEYLHYVVKPLEQIRRLHTDIELAQTALNQCASCDTVDLPRELVIELDDVFLNRSKSMKSNSGL